MEPKIHYGNTGDLTSGCIYLPNGSSGLTLTAPSSYGTTITYSNQINNNMNQQARVAVFKVTRNEDGKITQSSFIDEYWIEKKPGVSIDFAVAKLLSKKGEYKPEEIVIKEILTVAL
jgi:hypothetical protein